MLDMVKNLGKRPASPSRLTTELARDAPLVKRGSVYDLFDSELKGFHLCVGRLSKSWCIRTHYSTGPGTHRTIPPTGNREKALASIALSNEFSDPDLGGLPRNLPNGSVRGET